MPDQARIQVRKNDTENTWGDVGNKSGNESVPVVLTGSSASATPASVIVSGTEINDWETVGQVTYLGSEDKDGAWQVQKIDKSAFTMAYASQVNNATVTTYNDAWTDRATLTYQNYSLSK